MKNLILFIFVFITAISLGQEKDPKITLSFENTDLKLVLDEVEEQTGTTFFYLEPWIKPIKVTGNFSNIPLNELLATILKETLINFYVLPDKKIVFTRNNIIYDVLPDGFFGNDGPDTMLSEDIQDVNPVFYTDNKSTKKIRTETVHIGKELSNSGKKRLKLSGIVKNFITGEPISNLSIYSKNMRLGATTNDEGYYTLLLPPGLNILETSSMGIEDAQIRVVIYNDGVYNFSLQESVEELDEVVLRANLTENVEMATTGKNELNSEDSKNIPLVLGERDILRVATTLPGITTVGEGASGFNVRGGSTDQNLILMDNAVIYNPSHFFGIFQALNPFVTNNLDIYKGSIPAEYGGRLSSVFDIRTKNGSTDEFKGEGSIGPITNNIALEIPIVKEKSSLILGGRSTYSDWLLNSLDDASLKNSKASFFDLVSTYNHDINENNELKLTGYYSNDAFSITSDSIYKYSNKVFSLNWGHKFNDKHRASLILAHSGYDFNINYDGDSNKDFALGYRIKETEIKIKMRYLPFQKHKFDYGISSKLYGVNPGFIKPRGSESNVETTIIPNEKALESAIFLSDNYTVSDKFLVDVGIRYSFYAALGKLTDRQYEEGKPKNESTLQSTKEYGNNQIVQTYSAPEARISARYFLRPSLSLKGSFNNSTQFIHTLSNNTTVSPIDTWKLSDTNIKPAKAIQMALGIYKNFEDNLYELSLEGYYKKATNILDFKVGSQLLLNEHIETEVLQGRSRAYGMELLLRKSRGNLNGWLGYTYSRSMLKLDSEHAEERVNGGQYFPSNYDKPHDISLVLNYKFTKRYSLSANFIYQTGRPVTYPIGRYEYNNSEYVVYSDRNAFRIPDYYRLDLGFNMEGNHKLKKLAHSFWSFSIYNVLGRNNPYSVFFVTDNGEVKAYQSSIFAIPIPTVSYNFKF